MFRVIIYLFSENFKKFQKSLIDWINHFLVQKVKANSAFRSYAYQ